MVTVPVLGFSTLGLGLVRQAKRRQRDACEADAEFLERRAACNRLSQIFGQVIEFIFHVSLSLVVTEEVAILGRTDQRLARA